MSDLDPLFERYFIGVIVVSQIVYSVSAFAGAEYVVVAAVAAVHKYKLFVRTYGHGHSVIIQAYTPEYL